MRATPGLGFALTATFVLVPSPASAAEFFVDPEAGSADGEGSADDPWLTIQQVIDDGLIESQSWDGNAMVPLNPGAPVKAGDTLWLRTGDHGALSITGYHNQDVVTIAAADGESPRLASVLVRASSRWMLRGLHVSPEYAADYSNQTIVQLVDDAGQGPLERVTVEGCRIFSIADAGSWNASDWDGLSASGMQVAGRDMTIRDNTLTNVNFGISVTAEDSLIEGNVVDGFAGDGLRGLGDHSVFQYNTVKNCYDVNDNHDDGFQSWSVGDDGVGTGTVAGVVLRGNAIINYEDPEQPMRCTLQGIGLFDGTFVDWVVENNVVITDHWHGITFLGAENVRIVNNTVVDPNAESPGPPWIQIEAHKDGTPPADCIVRNNLATDFASADDGVVEDHNLVVEDPDALFVDAAGYDLHLLGSAEAVDSGSSELAPQLDRDRWPRPDGAGIDIGAYEWHEEPPPGDGDGDGDGDGTGDGDGDGDGDGAGDGDGDGDGDTGSGNDSVDTDSSADGCGCASQARTGPASLLLLGAIGALAVRSRRRSAR